MAREDNISKGLIVGFLTGGIVGAAVALLYAPKSGRALRQDISKGAEDAYHGAENYLEDAHRKAVSMINDGRRKSEDLIRDARGKAETLITDAERVINDAKERANKTVEDGKRLVNEEGERIKGAVKKGMDSYKETKGGAKSDETTA
jgi:gas vesicle protein